MAENTDQINNIQKRLQDLLAYPKESLDTELKEWLDLSQQVNKANLAQAILALANHGGGYIILGFTEVDGTYIPSESRPLDLNGYTQDIINGIIQSYADPSFHCDVYIENHPQIGAKFPIITVPGDHRVPIRAKRDGPNRTHVTQNTYYIRGAGPTSRPIQSAREWDELIKRCIRAAKDDLIDSIRDIVFGMVTPSDVAKPEQQAKEDFERWLQESRERWESLVAARLAQEKPSRYSNGIWTVAYSIVESFNPPTLSEFLKILQKVEGHETGWPPWLIPLSKEIAPYPYNNVIECWMVETLFQDAAHSDFWRAAPKGYCTE